MAFAEAEFNFGTKREYILDYAKLCYSAGCQMTMTPTDDGIEIYTLNKWVRLRMRLPKGNMHEMEVQTPSTWALVPTRLIRPLQCIEKDSEVKMVFRTDRCKVMSDVHTFEIMRYDFSPGEFEVPKYPISEKISPGRLIGFLSWVKKEKAERFTISLEEGYLVFSTRNSARTALRVISREKFTRDMNSFPGITALSCLLNLFDSSGKDHEPYFDCSVDPDDPKKPLRFQLQAHLGFIDLFLNPYIEPDAPVEDKHEGEEDDFAEEKA